MLMLKKEYIISSNRLFSHRQMQSYSNSVRSCLVIMMWVVVSHLHAKACEVSAPSPRWDALEALANQIPHDDGGMRQKEVYAHYLWSVYKSSTRSERPKIVHQISESLKQISYRDTRLDMIGVMLFGPENGRLILDLRDFDQDFYEKENFSQCLKYLDNLFKKHCGPLTSNGMRHHYSFNNICYYVEEMAMIEDAIIATCGWNNVAPSVADLENPRMDMTPAPIHGSDRYCARVSLHGISRMKLQSYAKAYKVVFESVPRKLHNKVQICYHRNASLGLCQCEKPHWRPIQKRSQASFMTPYEQSYVDVWFTTPTYGYVSMTLDEVPLELLRYVMLAGGVGLLFMSASTDTLDQNAAKSDRISKWVMHVVGIIVILQSSFDTILALVAVSFSLALVYTISFIRASIFKKKDAWEELREFLIKDDYADDYAAELAFAHDLRDWLIKNPDKIISLRDNSEDSE